MIIKKLKLKNIRSFENIELEFPKGSLLLAGDIGSGKTSVLMGLQFALFGLQPGQKGSSLLRHGEDEAYAKLEFEVDSNNIILERTIKKSKSGGITQDVNIITINGMSEEISTSEMKDKVIKILNYPKEFAKKSNLLYKFTVYTPQEEMKAIIQERPEIRLDTLRHIFGIDRYRRIKENAEIFIQKIKDSIKIKEVLASELSLLKEKLINESEKKISLAKEKNNLTYEFTKLTEDKAELEKKLENLKLLIEEKKQIDYQISNKNVFLQGKRDLELRLKKELLMMQKQLGEKINFSEESLRFTIDILENHKKSLEEINKEHLNVNSRIYALESKKEAPLKLKNQVTSMENCPTCFQIVGSEHKEKISKKTQFDLEDIDRELSNLYLRRIQVIKDVEKEKELVSGYESDKNKLEHDKIKSEHQKTIEIKFKSDSFVLERTSNEVISVENEIIALEEKSKLFKDKEIMFENIKSDLDKSTKEWRIKEITIATKSKELELLVSRLDELKDEISKKEKVREDINRLRILQDWLAEKFILMVGLTEKNVMSKLRTEFSKIFSEWFSMLVSDSLSVRLDEDFTPKITNQDYEMDYEFLSGGERTAVALAYRLSLNQVLNSMLSSIKTKDLVILDEPTDGFASEQIDKMRDIFIQLKAKQIILVSHEQKIEGFVDHVLRVRKDSTSVIQ